LYHLNQDKLSVSTADDWGSKVPDVTAVHSDVESIQSTVLPAKIEDKVLPQQNKRLKTLSEFFTNFAIPDEGFWAVKYINQPETVDILVQQYTQHKKRIKTAYAIDENKRFFEGYSDYHTHRYLLETLVGEGNIKGSTSMVELEKYVKEPDDTKTSIKINNLKNSMHQLFPDIFQFVDGESKTNFDSFTPEFIQNLHKQVMVNLVDNPGAYRTNWAAPSQENWMFLVPEKIPENLDRLCKDLRKELEDELEIDLDENVLVRRVKIVTNFFTHFLQIHPFSNGNGRVARLLISWLMADLSVVPVPLLTTFASRNTYLDCLRDSRRSSPFVPGNLARFIFESVIQTIKVVCVSLDI